MRFLPRLALPFTVALVGALTLAACDQADPAPGSATSGLAPDAPTASAQAKVDVCHASGNGSYHLISVAAAAVDAHRAHGDALPGEPVPGMVGSTFDDACMPQEEALCPCFDAASLAAGGEVSMCGDGVGGQDRAFIAYAATVGGGSACSGIPCSSLENLSCYIQSSGGVGFANPITAAEDAACRALIVDACPNGRSSTSAARGTPSSTPFFSR